MTVVHVVLLSFKADASADAIAACLRELRGLAAMPGVLQLSSLAAKTLRRAGASSRMR